MSEPWVPAGPVRDEAIRDGSIRLGQFLKLSGLVDVGSDAKALLEEGEVQVNGDVERRRGRQLQVGDVVTVAGTDHVRVASEP
jgi:ribosome-associated protein